MPTYGYNQIGATEHFIDNWKFSTSVRPILKIVPDQDFRLDRVHIYAKFPNNAQLRMGLVYPQGGGVYPFTKLEPGSASYPSNSSYSPSGYMYATEGEGWYSATLNWGPLLEEGETYYITLGETRGSGIYSQHDITLFYDDNAAGNGGHMDYGGRDSSGTAWLENIANTNRNYSMYVTGRVGGQSAGKTFTGTGAMVDGGGDRMYLTKLPILTETTEVDAVYVYPVGSQTGNSFSTTARFFIYNSSGTFIKRSGNWGSGNVTGWYQAPFQEPYPTLQFGEQYYLGIAQVRYPSGVPNIWGWRYNNCRVDSARWGRWKTWVNAVNSSDDIDIGTFTEAWTPAATFLYGTEAEQYIGPILKVEGLDIRTEIARIDQAPGSSIEAIENMDYLTTI